MSQGIKKPSNLRVRGFRRFGVCLGLVVTAGVDGRLTEKLSGDSVDDAGVQVGDQEDDVGSGDADVVKPAVHVQGDGSQFFIVLPLSVSVGTGTPWAATAWLKVSRTIGPVTRRRQVTSKA
ncbi:hypothetical protein ABT120_11490 [Nonomuraea angiospora]|uniref:hypothetical protein n=1 Tax=Nonomuraea angiospora TaxID=46172 RepID=UPI00331F5FCD